MRELAQALELHMSALEGVPYSLMNKMNCIAQEIEVTSYVEEKGYEPKTAALLQQFRECLNNT